MMRCRVPKQLADCRDHIGRVERSAIERGPYDQEYLCHQQYYGLLEVSVKSRDAIPIANLIL